MSPSCSTVSFHLQTRNLSSRGGRLNSELIQCTREDVLSLLVKISPIAKISNLFICLSDKKKFKWLVKFIHTASRKLFHIFDSLVSRLETNGNQLPKSLGSCWGHLQALLTYFPLPCGIDGLGLAGLRSQTSGNKKEGEAVEMNEEVSFHSPHPDLQHLHCIAAVKIFALSAKAD